MFQTSFGLIFFFPSKGQAYYFTIKKQRSNNVKRFSYTDVNHHLVCIVLLLHSRDINCLKLTLSDHFLVYILEWKYSLLIVCFVHPFFKKQYEKQFGIN